MNTTHIIVKNSRVHNLKNICVEIPKNKIVVFTGVSGSGKSSLVFDTVCAEARRQLIDTFSSFARKRLPKISRPTIDEIHNISTAIVIDQKPMGITLRSTVGTATELYTYLRLLFSRFGKPFVGFSDFYSFNNPEGMCQACSGLGREMIIDESKIINSEVSLAQGALIHSEYKKGGYNWKEIVSSGFFDPHKKIKDFSTEEKEKLLFSAKIMFTKELAGEKTRSYFEGVITKLKRVFSNRKDGENAYTRFFTYRECSVCNGIRINEKARKVKFAGSTIGELVNLELPDLFLWLDMISGSEAEVIIKKMKSMIKHLIDIGVGYLSLHRPVATLSGGEAQRVKTARQLDCDLIGLMYVFDEPTIGLHPKDVDKLLPLFITLRDRGNSLLIVEHDVTIIKQADHIINIGPEAGTKGGHITFQGNFESLINSTTKIAHYLDRTIHTGCKRKPWTEYYEIKNANLYNLKNISVKIPKKIFTVVTGVAGSGKSTLIHDVFAKKQSEAIIIDQRSVGRTSRGVPATYIGIFKEIRKLFAKENNCDPSYFSFNSKGACPECKGAGIIKVEMSFLDDVSMVCEKCNGNRYSNEVLALLYSGKSISDVLSMTASEALSFFDLQSIKIKLEILVRIGLGYLALGQPLSSLSGGEAQRLKLASELHKKGNLYILDEPTTGLHLSDIEKLLFIIKDLVVHGNTVILIEHNMELAACADWVIDMGPGGGKYGGKIVAQGIPEEIAACAASYTGKYLKKILQIEK